MGSVEPIKSIFQFTLISLHTDFEFPSNQCEAGTPCICWKISVKNPGIRAVVVSQSKPRQTLVTAFGAFPRDPGERLQKL